MARPALRQDEIEAFRNRLCDVATRRFADHGLAGVSLRGLSAELGCSATTPYRYFENKDEIFAAVRARAFGRLADVCEEVCARESDPGLRIAEMGRAYLRFAREEPHAYRVAFELAQPDASDYPELLAERARAWRAMRSAVADATRRGFLTGDPEIVSHVFWAGVHGLAALELAGQLQLRALDDLEATMIETLVRGARSAALPIPPGA